MSGKQPRHIGKYEVIAKVAQGGMAALYKARHPTLDRTVLLKRLALRGGPQFVERFRREAELMMDLKDDHIVRVYDHFKEGASYYIVEEFVDGMSLDALIKRERYLSNDAATLLTYEVARGLKHAHDRGVIHRDIKPSNILISHAGEVKLADFGIATSSSDTEDGLTQTGMTLGTPCYIAPEQIGDAKNVDKRADIYSLGVVLYEMLTGRAPFAANFSPETISAIHKGRHAPARQWNPRISAVLQRVMHKAMRPRRARRYRDLDRVIAILGRRIGKRDQSSIRGGVKAVLKGADIEELFRRRLPRSWAVAGGAAGLCLLAVGAWQLYRQGLHLELFAAERFGAVVATVRVDSAAKKPGEIFIKPLLYREEANAVTLVEDTRFGLRQEPALRTKGSYVFRSRKLYLPPGDYRLKVNLEGQLHWQSFHVDSRLAQRAHPDTAGALELAVALERAAPLPLEVRVKALDAVSGEDITTGTELRLYRDSGWFPWSAELAAGLRSGGAYRFMLSREGYFPQYYNLAVESFQSLLRIEARLTPRPGRLLLVSSAAGLPVKIDGSERYLSGGTERAWRRLEPLEEGETELVLAPGTYLLAVGKGSEATSAFVRILPDRTLTARIERGEAGGPARITTASALPE